MGEYTNALVSALQGASNAAASNISGPVDLLSWALRKAGVPVPSNPVMGSEWMRQKGLLADPRNKLAGLLGEGLGMAAPAVAAAKAPEIARGLLNVADDFQAYNKALGPAGVSQATVWHGSPHKFDRFDSSKIGTGEGAQAYGHGLYLADAKNVADEYAGKLSKPMVTTATGRTVENMQGLSAEAQQLLKAMQNDAERAMYGARYSSATQRLWNAPQSVQKELIGNAERWNALDVLDSGSLYKVDLPDPLISRMLDWDKPLSQQAPEVRKAIDGIVEAEELYKGKYAPRFLDKRTTAGDAINVFNDALGGPSVTSNYLRQAGIPGVRYLDGGSRGAGAGTSNYVVFPGEESALTILERNGSPINALVKALQGPR